MAARAPVKPARPRARRAPAAAPSWTDAWIFASLAAKGSTRRRELIERADALNHAIPTDAEIRSAMRYLHGRGLIVVRGRTVALTAWGRAVHENGLARRGGLFSIADNMLKALRSPRFRA